MFLSVQELSLDLCLFAEFVIECVENAKMCVFHCVFVQICTNIDQNMHQYRPKYVQIGQRSAYLSVKVAICKGIQRNLLLFSEKRSKKARLSA